MKEELIKIERKDGIIYERKKRKEGVYSKNLNIKIKGETIEEFKKIAENEGMKYQTLIRSILEDFVEKYK